MTARTPAPGRVWMNRATGNALAACLRCSVRWVLGPSLEDVADDLRAHLRTEHADLWRECAYCRGQGKVGGPYWMPPPGLIQCRLCHGRGYIETERSKA